jgi:hypothetical protein
MTLHAQGPPPRDCGVLCVRATTTPVHPTSNSSLPISQAGRAAAGAGAAAAAAAGGRGHRGQLESSPLSVLESRDTGGVDGVDGKVREEGRVTLDVHVELGVAHCASSMAVGYMIRGMSHPHVTFLRRESTDVQQQQWVPGGTSGQCAAKLEGRPTAVKAFTFGVHWQAEASPK